MNFILNGKKVNIRRLTICDVQDIHKNINDKQITKWTLRIPYPYKKIYALRFIKESKYNLKKKTAHVFGIVLKKTDNVIGIIDLHSICWENKNAEIGYWIGRRFWGEGITTEAVKLVSQFGFKKLHLKRIYAKVFNGNKASLQVLQKNGFKKEGVLRKSRFKNNKWIDEIILSKLNTSN